MHRCWVLTLHCDVGAGDEVVEVVGDLYILVLPHSFKLLPRIEALPDVLWEEVGSLRVDDLQGGRQGVRLH